mmetsp:Transcript_4814/g.7221  ORF Transcript_4814/g.7221 Transcript_4814/m.7221 type:complete len:228 (-) Transcript_4814:328-1011(-)
MSPPNKPTSFEKIASLLDSEPFSAHTIPKLEEYLEEQVQEEAYDFAANKCLLRLYQFYPDLTNEHEVARIVAKAMMNLPNTDLLTLLYLVPDRLVLKEPFRTLMRCHECLEQAQLQEFWAAANLGSNELLDGIPGFAKEMRKFMVHLLSATCQKYPAQDFCSALNLEEKELAGFVKDSEGAVTLADQEGNVAFALNDSNQSKPQQFQQREVVQLDQMLQIMKSVGSM